MENFVFFGGKIYVSSYLTKLSWEELPKLKPGDLIFIGIWTGIVKEIDEFGACPDPEDEHKALGVVARCVFIKNLSWINEEISDSLSLSLLKKDYNKYPHTRNSWYFHSDYYDCPWTCFVTKDTKNRIEKEMSKNSSV